MNYGYDKTNPNWKEERKQLLAARLTEMILPLQLNDALTSPYVEVDQQYPGVRVRRITNLSDEQRDVFIDTADAIYKSVMA